MTRHAIKDRLTRDFRDAIQAVKWYEIPERDQTILLSELFSECLASCIVGAVFPKDAHPDTLALAKAKVSLRLMMDSQTLQGELARERAATN